MSKYCFLMQVDPDLLEQYRERHRQVWPDMLQSLADSGWHNYSIFVRPDGLVVGYVEADDLAAAQDAMAAHDVNTRWQAEMSRFFVGTGARPQEGRLELLDQIFDLDEQRAAVVAFRGQGGPS